MQAHWGAMFSIRGYSLACESILNRYQVLLTKNWNVLMVWSVNKSVCGSTCLKENYNQKVIPTQMINPSPPPWPRFPTTPQIISRTSWYFELKSGINCCPSDRGFFPARISKRWRTFFFSGSSVILGVTCLKTDLSFAEEHKRFSTRCTDHIQCTCGGREKLKYFDTTSQHYVSETIIQQPR